MDKQPFYKDGSGRVLIGLAALAITLGVVGFRQNVSTQSTREQAVVPGINDLPFGDEPAQGTVHEISVGSTKIAAIYAKTDEELTLGLTTTDSLDKNSGMVYFFESADVSGYSPLGMKFPVDLIWVGSDSKVVNIDQDVVYLTDAPEKQYDAGGAATYLIEVNAGFVSQNDIKVGDPVSLPE